MSPGVKRAAERVIRVGAVAYDPKVVTIWEGIREHFQEQGVLMDYVLFSHYDAQVDALLKQSIEIAWNTNLAYVKTYQGTRGQCKALVMRDTDVGFTTKIVARADAGVETLQDLRGHRFAFGSRDSAQAAILPAYFLREEGLDPEKDLVPIRFDLDVGKHGDTGTSELAVVRVVETGEADAGALGDVTWIRLVAEGQVDTRRVRPIWTSPGYCHCNFTALAGFDEELASRFTKALLAMDYNNPAHRTIMDLEGLKRWVPAQTEGYEVLFRAAEAQGIIRRK